MTARRWTWQLALVAGLAAALVLLVAGGANAQGGKAAPGRALADGITVGPDGNIWYTEFKTRRIGRITPAGKITRFGEPARGPADITTGPDGALWFTEYGDKLGRITTTGKITEIDVPFGNYRAITTGPDGRLWFVDKDGDKIVAVTTQGAATAYPLNPGSTPEEIITGPDGNLWVTLSSRHGIARVTPAGAVSEFLLASNAGNPAGIVVGPDGALWFTEGTLPIVGRITTAGVITEVPVATTAASGASGITVGSDGALWMAYPQDNRIGRLTTTGQYSEQPLATPGANPLKIVGLPASGVWFTENGKDRIGRVTPGGATGIGPIAEFAYDTTPPKVTVTVSATARSAARAGLRRGRKLSLPTRVKCSRACSVKAELLASKGVARSLGVSGSGTLISLGATNNGLAKNRIVRVGLSAKISRALARRGTTSLTLRVLVNDRLANAALVTRKVSI